MMEWWNKALNYGRGLFYRWLFDRCGLIQVTGRIFVIKKNARINIGKCLIWKHVKFDMEGRNKDQPAILEIGNLSTIGDRTEIHVAEKVSIGREVLIGWDCVIMDRNYHGIEDQEEKVSPVIIEDNVWIGCRSIILPGVKIGKGAVIGAGSVVTRDVHPKTIAAGNPAKNIREI
ncbi:MAG: acyltransferase [Nitrospirota bacterium]